MTSFTFVVPSIGYGGCMDTTERIDSFFTDLAVRTQHTTSRALDDLPAPLGRIVQRTGAFQAEVLRQLGLVTSTGFAAAHDLARTAWTGVTSMAELGEDVLEDTVRTARRTGERIADDVEDAFDTASRRARGAAGAVERRMRAVPDRAETVAGRVSRQADRSGDRVAGAVAKSGGYEDWTKDELYEKAQELDIDGRSQMSKDELVEALRSA